MTMVRKECHNCLSMMSCLCKCHLLLLYFNRIQWLKTHAQHHHPNIAYTRIPSRGAGTSLIDVACKCHLLLLSFIYCKFIIANTQISSFYYRFEKRRSYHWLDVCKCHCYCCLSLFTPSFSYIFFVVAPLTNRRGPGIRNRINRHPSVGQATVL